MSIQGKLNLIALAGVLALLSFATATYLLILAIQSVMQGNIAHTILYATGSGLSLGLYDRLAKALPSKKTMDTIIHSLNRKR